MVSWKALFLVPVLAFGCLASVPANAQWGTAVSKDTSLTVFAVKDMKSEDGGFGAALTKYDMGVTDISFADLDSFKVGTFSKLSPKQFGLFPVYLGFALGYASADDTALDAPDGMLSGLALIAYRSNLAAGLSLELRATSLSEEFDPIAWFSNPDILMVGAGLSYSF